MLIFEGAVAILAIAGAIAARIFWGDVKIRIGPSDPEARRKPSYRIAVGVSGALLCVITAWLGDGVFSGYGREFAEAWIGIGILFIIVTIAWLIFRW
jgi:hypothetical protein